MPAVHQKNDITFCHHVKVFCSRFSQSLATKWSGLIEKDALVMKLPMRCQEIQTTIWHLIQGTKNL
jgi:hypothetical protein